MTLKTEASYQVGGNFKHSVLNQLPRKDRIQGRIFFFFLNYAPKKDVTANQGKNSNIPIIKVNNRPLPETFLPNCSCL